MESIDPNLAKSKLKYWFQDETRIGLKTIERKRIIVFGVKPIGKLQWNFKAYYLYGAVAPQTRESCGERVFTSFWVCAFKYSEIDGQRNIPII